MNVDRSLRAAVGWALPVLVAWALLAALWNFGGSWQLARGLQAPGPTASTLAGLVLLAIAAGLIVAVRRWPKRFVLLACVGGLAALVGVVGAFTQDPALWPSESWRWAGIVLNGVGFVAAVAAVIAFVRWKSIP
jgi:peptidoglycan/LPS O-acetylase OafA/YrhL